jgi:hypothetical protein
VYCSYSKSLAGIEEVFWYGMGYIKTIELSLDPYRDTATKMVVLFFGQGFSVVGEDVV